MLRAMTKVIYVYPDYEEYGFDLAGFERASDEEKYVWAKNCNETAVYSLQDFQDAFNREHISSMGFIYIVQI
jgi:hypothetical protein